MSWGIAETAPEKEKIKAEYADRLNGYNSCGRIDYDVYSDLFDDGMELLDKMHEQGKKDAEQTETIRCKDCKHCAYDYYDLMCTNQKTLVMVTDENFGCVYAERR